MNARPPWVTSAASAVERTLAGAHRAAAWCWRTGHVYLLSCPVRGRRWYWRTLGYTTWGTAAAAPLAVGGVLLAAAGPLAWGIAGATVTVTCWAAGQDDSEEPEEDEEAEPAGPTDPLLALAAQLTGDANGVHLTALLTALHRAGTDPRFGTVELRAALAERGVAWRPSVRAPKGGVPGAPEKVNQGVHRADLEAVIGPLPDPSPGPLPGPAATATNSAVTCDVASVATAVATTGSGT